MTRSLVLALPCLSHCLRFLDGGVHGQQLARLLQASQGVTALLGITLCYWLPSPTCT
jgi:hypothetical protein